MPSFSKSEVVLVRYPFSDLTNLKVRPAVIMGTQEDSKDIFIVPLTSKLSSLLSGEFILSDWRNSGLNVPTAVKRGIYTIDRGLILKSLGKLSPDDVHQLEGSLRRWLEIQDEKTIIKTIKDRFQNYPFAAIEEAVVNAGYHRNYKRWDERRDVVSD